MDWNYVGAVALGIAIGALGAFLKGFTGEAGKAAYQRLLGKAPPLMTDTGYAERQKLYATADLVWSQSGKAHAREEEGWTYFIVPKKRGQAHVQGPGGTYSVLMVKPGAKKLQAS